MQDAAQSAGTEGVSSWRRRVSAPLLALLRQGATPPKLALAVAFGFTVGVFPVLGTTTILAVVLAAIFRLNQPAMQIGNALSSIPFFILLVPFVRLGEQLTGSGPFPLDVDLLRETAKEGIVPMMNAFGLAILHGIVGWAVAAPVLTAALYFICLPLIRRFNVSR